MTQAGVLHNPGVFLSMAQAAVLDQFV